MQAFPRKLLKGNTNCFVLIKNCLNNFYYVISSFKEAITPGNLTLTEKKQQCMHIRSEGLVTVKRDEQ